MAQHDLYCQAHRDYNVDRHQKTMRFLQWSREVRTFQTFLYRASLPSTQNPEEEVLMAAQQYQQLKSPKYQKKEKNFHRDDSSKPKYYLDRAQKTILLRNLRQDFVWEDDL